jgi:hypothetical protein
MQIVVYALLGAGAVSCALFLAVRVKSVGPAALLLKTLTSVFFIATGIFAFMSNAAIDTVFGLLVIFGLVFGLLGDIMLDLKFCYPKDNDIYTYAGMGCFALGHISYLSGIYLTFYTGDLLTLLLPIAGAVVFACVAVFGGPMLKMRYGKFKLPSLIYGFLLSFMLLTNIAFLAVSPSPFWVLMMLGGLMFIVSDLVLAPMYFTFKKTVDEAGNEIEVLALAKSPLLVIVNHVTYYAAQFLLAVALLLF